MSYNPILAKGQATSANSAPVVIASDNTLLTIGSRPLIIKGTVNNGQTAYSSLGISVGGLITVATGLPAGTIILNPTMRWKVPLTGFTTGNVASQIFDANPTASTFTDNVTAVLAAADIPKTRNATNGALAWVSPSTGGLVVGLASSGATRATVDASGNVYFVFTTTSTSLVFASTNSINYDFECSY